MKNECVIFDFETLSVDRVNGVVLSMAMLNYSEERFVSKPYKYDELIEKCSLIKFDVEKQVKNYKRTIDKDTLSWWNQQSDEAKKQLKPSAADQDIGELYDFIFSNCSIKEVNKVFSRGNTFDPIFLDYIFRQCKQPDIFTHWTLRDTRSYIEGLSYGSNLKNSFIPEGLNELFVAHDPSHDIVMDVMRMQTLVQAIS